MENNSKPLVSILMPTYNHEKFIAKSIESALSQKTDYSWELLINDDCSTDGTLEIARSYQKKYPEKIKVFAHEKNQGLLKSYKFLLGNAAGKYFAVLESDDIWSDSSKLQKQVSFLESHDDYGLCCSDYYTIDENGNKTGEVVKDFDKGLNGEWFDALMNFASIGALTLVIRKSVYDKYCNIDDYIERNFQTFDRATWLSVSKHSKCFFIHEKLASYRVMSSSISNSGKFQKALSFADSIMEIHEYIIQKEGLGSTTRAKFDEEKQIWYINLSINHRNFAEFKKHAKLLKGVSLKSKMIHHFPRLFWIFYEFKHPVPKHLKK